MFIFSIQCLLRRTGCSNRHIADGQPRIQAFFPGANACYSDDAMEYAGAFSISEVQHAYSKNGGTTIYNGAYSLGWIRPASPGIFSAFPFIPGEGDQTRRLHAPV